MHYGEKWIVPFDWPCEITPVYKILQNCALRKPAKKALQFGPSGYSMTNQNFLTSGIYFGSSKAYFFEIFSTGGFLCMANRIVLSIFYHNAYVKIDLQVQMPTLVHYYAS